MSNEKQELRQFKDGKDTFTFDQNSGYWFNQDHTKMQDHQDEFIPFGSEWEIAMKKIPKAYLIDMLRKELKGKHEKLTSPSVEQPSVDGELLEALKEAEQVLSKHYASHPVLTKIDNLLARREGSKSQNEKQKHDWQICPMCSGTKMQSGYIDQNYGWVTIPSPCQTCHQTGLISRQTGVPPGVDGELLSKVKYNLQRIALADEEMVKSPGAAETYRMICRETLELIARREAAPHKVNDTLRNPSEV